MKVARSRMIRASVDDVWRVLADPYALPRWWPLVRRVEGVREDGWTMLLGRQGGRGVRADQRLEASEPERLRRWSLVVPGSPFERVLSASLVEARLAPAGERCELGLELRQAPRGWARFGAFMLRRAARRQLDEALDGMARAVEASDPAVEASDRAGAGSDPAVEASDRAGPGSDPTRSDPARASGS